MGNTNEEDYVAKHQKYLKKRVFCPFCLTTGERYTDFSSEMGMTCGPLGLILIVLKEGWHESATFRRIV